MDGGAARGGSRKVMAGPEYNSLNLAAAHMAVLGTYRHACKAAEFRELYCDLGGGDSAGGGCWSRFGNGERGGGEHIQVRNGHFS